MVDEKLPVQKSNAADVDAFLRKVAATPPPSRDGSAAGRLIFAMDATASRGPTWDRAARIQGEMFQATSALGGLELQLAFYRGFGEFKVSRWIRDSMALSRLMTSVGCLAGETQIAKVLQHAIDETGRGRVAALVFVGDSVEEDPDRLGKLAGELGVLGVPVFLFHEGDDPLAAIVFRQIAQLSGGACVNFDSASPGVLGELLAAVAVFAAGGRRALENMADKRGGEVLRIAHQMRR